MFVECRKEASSYVEGLQYKIYKLTNLVGVEIYVSCCCQGGQGCCRTTLINTLRSKLPLQPDVSVHVCVSDLWPLARHRPRARLGLLTSARCPNRARTLLAPVAPVRVARAALTEDGLGREKFETLQNQ